jgi:hypothetical protein
MPLDLEKMIDEIEKVLTKSLDSILSNVDKLESGLQKEIEKLIRDGFAVKGGKITKTTGNIKEILKIKRKIDAYVLGGFFTKELKVFEPAFKAIAELVTDNYSEFASGNALEVANLVKEQSIELVKEQFIAEGISSEVMPELSNILRNSVIRGLTIDETVKAVNELVASGLLPNAAKRITIDGLVTYSRNYINAITKDFENEWYFYEGPLRKSSRQFCETRAGKYYTKKQVESWAKLDWQGKKPGTTKQTIFSLAGGYNCYHLILPVPTELVPEEYLNK